MKTHCSCPNTSCRRYGNCVACREFHRRVNSPAHCDKITAARQPDPSGVNLMDYAACAG